MHLIFLLYIFKCIHAYAFGYKLVVIVIDKALALGILNSKFLAFSTPKITKSLPLDVSIVKCQVDSYFFNLFFFLNNKTKAFIDQDGI